MANTESTNVLVKNVTFYWAKLDKAVEPFGELRYELQIQGDKSRFDEFNEYGKAKINENGNVQVNLQKKAFKRDGTEAAKVRVVDSNKLPFDPKLIGNGSTGNVIVMRRPYEMKGPNGKVTKKGISTMLLAVQVVNLVKYEPKDSVDFDEVDTTDTGNDIDDNF